MKNILTYLLIGFLLANCNTPQKKIPDHHERAELIPEPDRHERLTGEAIEKLKNANCVCLNPDTSLSGIALRNTASADKIIGTDNKMDETDQYHFYSKPDREILTLTQHAGDGENQISIFKVSFADKADYGYKQLNVVTFETEKAIKLGMTKEEVVNRLGHCYATVDSTKDVIELYYRIETPKDSKTKILESNNMPVYYATYVFWKNELSNYEFGFEYP